MNYLLYEKEFAILKIKNTYKLFKYQKTPFSNGELLYVYIKQKVRNKYGNSD